MTNSEPVQGVFADLDHYVAFPRLGGLALSADGTRLVTAVSTMTRKGTGYASALWEIDPAGERPAYRLTRSAKGEAGAAFHVNGDLLFTSSRPDPDSDEDEPETSLWRIPAVGGEARTVLSRPGGFGGVRCARSADVTVVMAPVLAGASDEREQAALHQSRKKAGVAAILHDAYPVRFWDHDLGPTEPHLFVVEDDGEAEHPTGPVTTDRTAPARLRRVSDGVGGGLREMPYDVSPDGSFVLTTLAVPGAAGSLRETIVRIDLATGERTVVLDEPNREFFAPVISPDGSRAVVVTSPISTPETAPHMSLLLVDLASGSTQPLAADWDRWSHPWCWLPDGSAVLVNADDHGASPVFQVSVPDGVVTRVTADAAAYGDVVVAPDGRVAYATRSSYEFPAEVVRIDLSSGEVTPLPGPVSRPALPGRLEEVVTTRDDGTDVRSWLCLPPAEQAGDAGFPLLLWIHGGPLGSWNAWSWRWNPWLMVAQGYAVLLPDPALSTGYGQDFIQRGWGVWGGPPYDDLMAATDTVVERVDIDESRTAAMGGSFGGYMANWVAGHTDRFRAIVTHASLWALDQFGPTTDASFYWQREMTDEMATANSPHRFVDQIVTPMLVIHGDKDYRVPIGEGLRLWYELLAKSGLPAGDDGSTVHRFLYFPDENHWILSPQHAKVWYAVVTNFLAEHVLGQAPPDLPLELGRTRPGRELLDKLDA